MMVLHITELLVRAVDTLLTQKRTSPFRWCTVTCQSVSNTTGTADGGPEDRSQLAAGSGP